MRTLSLIGLCVFGLWACGGSESSDTGTGGTTTGGKGGSGGTAAKGGTGGTSTGGTSTGGTTSGGSGGTSTGGTATGGSAGTMSGGTAGVSAGGTAGTSSGGTAGAATDGGTTCGKQCTDAGFKCCGNTCVNPNNDILNCGTCGNKCGGEHPSCNGGQCGKPECVAGTACAGTQFCCGSACCNAGDLCCNVPGPVATGPKCTAPVNGTCPLGCLQCKCAAPDTPIATPTGERAIKDIHIGDLVLSVDHGRVVPVPVSQINRTPVRDHHILRIRLDTGRVIELSPGHPTADGRKLAEVGAGGVLDGTRVTTFELVSYGEPFTYDILPESDSGAYFAGGVLIGSTLKGSAVNVTSLDARALVCH